MICVSLGNTKFENALELSSKVRMMEFRADLLNWSPDEYVRIIGEIPVSLYTFRPGVISDKERIEYYRFAIDHKVNYVDVEIESSPEFLAEIQQMIKNTRSELVVSYHNYDTTPDVEELKGILDDCYKKGASVAKLACMVNDHADAANLLSLYAFQGRKVVVGMGEKGRIVRLSSCLLGAEFTFAAPDKGLVTAPGQMTWQEMEIILNLIQS